MQMTMETLKGFLISAKLHLLSKDTPFEWDDACQKAFEKLKGLLISAPIMQHRLEFTFWGNVWWKRLCNRWGIGQRKEKKAHNIYNASRNLNSAQMNYSTTEKEISAVVFVLDKFRSYLLGSKIINFTDHAAL